MKTLLAVGLGYSAKEIARRLASSPLPLGEVRAERRVRGDDDGSEHTHPSPGMLRIPPSPARGEGEQAANSLPDIDTRDSRESALSPPVSLYGERQAFAFGRGLSPENTASPPSPLAGEGSRQRRVGEGENRWRIIGTARGAESLEAIRALGYEGLPFTGDAPSVELARAIGEATHLLVSAAPDEAGDPLLAQHRADLEAAPKLQWVGYLSTIGVYGDHQGAWVDETTAPRPVSERSRMRLEAERAWEAFAAARGAALQIFRLAGIYGPGRNPLERLKAGRERTIVKRAQLFNRIHVADIATTVLAGIEAGNRASGVFNVTDDEPAAPEDVAAYAGSLLGIDPPPLIPWEEAEQSMTPMARSFYMETKRVRNSRIKDTLGVELAYPTYREGLRDLARGMVS